MVQVEIPQEAPPAPEEAPAETPADAPPAEGEAAPAEGEAAPAAEGEATPAESAPAPEPVFETVRQAAELGEHVLIRNNKEHEFERLSIS